MARPGRLKAIVEPVLLYNRTTTGMSLRVLKSNAHICTRCIAHFSQSTQTSRFYRPLLSTRTSLQQHARLYASAAEKTPLQVAIPRTLKEQHALVKALYAEITQDPAKTKSIPDEKSIMRVLGTYESLVSRLVDDSHITSTPASDAPASQSANATSAMLKSIDKPQTGSKITAADILVDISSKATSIIETPSIFITAPVLKSYINLQSQLNRPQNFPFIFDLYRHKPSPRPLDKAPYMTLAAPTPTAASVAVDKDVASTALSAAIKLHSLPLCLDIIESTYCTRAYAKGKVLRNAIVPLGGAALAPLAAYALASQFALLQNTMDSAHATTVAMAGIMTYVATVGSMGYIAITTANDQMVRVTWASGLPLWERWVREEERVAIDRVAQAWGFKNRVRWGDEEGSEWESLREWAGLRGMILDRVELMQGMQ